MDNQNQPLDKEVMYVMKSKWLQKWLVLLVVVLLISGCGFHDPLEKQRAMWDRNPQQPVTFAVAGRIPFLTTNTGFMNGVLFYQQFDDRLLHP